MAPEENGASSEGEALLHTMRSLFKSKKKRTEKVLSVYLIFFFLFLKYIRTASHQSELCINFHGVNPWIGQQIQKILASSFCKRQKGIGCIGLCWGQYWQPLRRCVGPVAKAPLAGWASGAEEASQPLSGQIIEAHFVLFFRKNLTSCNIINSTCLDFKFS